MKLIKQSVEDFTQTKFDYVSILKQIEKCARITYKSEDRITDTSYEKFINNLINLDHSRPLEFGTVHLKMTANEWDNLIDTLIYHEAFNQIWIKAKQDPDTLDMYITTNYRYFLIIKTLGIDIEKYFTEEDNEWFPKRYTFKFITDRGIMDDLRTHVTLSHLGESTRWIKYNRSKFNSELTYIDFESSEGEMNSLMPTFTMAEDDYMENTSQRGYKPDQARRVLPLGIKSELVSCGFMSAWENFIYRRSAKDAHPMAQELSNKVEKELSNKVEKEFIKIQLSKNEN